MTAKYMTPFYIERLMLLGPGNQGPGRRKYLEYRRTILLELIEMGYTNVVIMEDVMDVLKDLSLDEKFRRIVNDYNPRLFIAFFHVGARMDGVAFELGWLCCKYNLSELERRLLLFASKGYKWNTTTSYIPSLFPNIGPIPLIDSNPNLKPSRLINRRVLHLILRS